LKTLVEALGEGRVVAIATESFFGLLADATSSPAIDALLALKPRGADKGIPLILPGRTSWEALVAGVPPEAAALADAFWPGALSIALPVGSGVDARLALDGTVAVRLPGASPAAELSRAFGRPLTATSANLPGSPPATRAEQVLGAFPIPVKNRSLLVVPGESPGGAPSTVVVFAAGKARVLREGRVETSELASVLSRLGVRLDEPLPRR
jgi:tRNA threonylcarbamoyl adenosine modification protein (Sua5/YciO/YrdC/YwlC family)